MPITLYRINLINVCHSFAGIFLGLTLVCSRRSLIVSSQSLTFDIMLDLVTPPPNSQSALGAVLRDLGQALLRQQKSGLPSLRIDTFCRVLTGKISEINSQTRSYQLGHNRVSPSLIVSFCFCKIVNHH